MSKESGTSDGAPDHGPAPSHREVHYVYSTTLVPLLRNLRASVLVSTYQAGKVVVVGVDEQGSLALTFHNFERAMGVAVRPDRIAVGTLNQIWLLRANPDIGPKLGLPGRHDACFLARSSHMTGDIQVHEMAWVGEELWMVNTLFSCLCTLHERHSFEPRWRPPFITALAPEDRCHLNGFALEDGRPKYVTAMAETDTPRGWRPDKASTGCLIDVPSGETVAQGFAMPHSPRAYQGRVLLLDSGKGRLVVVDPSSGKVDAVAEQPGYARGLALYGSYAFVGQSKIRETSTFGGVPIAERRESLRCGVGVVELTTGRHVAHLEFTTGVDEIFDVQLLLGVRLPALSGPFAGRDGMLPIWTVPDAHTRETSASRDRSLEKCFECSRKRLKWGRGRALARIAAVPYLDQASSICPLRIIATNR
jgi:uncharacterized protein (TIGR03032 family)